MGHDLFPSKSILYIIIAVFDMTYSPLWDRLFFLAAEDDEIEERFDLLYGLAVDLNDAIGELSD
jgi:hypothetical protein